MFYEMFGTREIRKEKKKRQFEDEKYNPGERERKKWSDVQLKHLIEGGEEQEAEPMKSKV